MAYIHTKHHSEESIREAEKVAEKLKEFKLDGYVVTAEPIDEYKVTLFLNGREGYRKDLGEFPSVKAFNGDDYSKQLLSEVRKRMDAQKEKDIELHNKLSEIIEKLTSQLNFQDILKETSKLTVSMVEMIAEVFDRFPLYKLYREELEALAALPEYEEADLDRLSLDYSDEGKSIEADTLHNKALNLALERAEKRLKEQEKQDKRKKEDKQDKQDNIEIIEGQGIEDVIKQVNEAKKDEIAAKAKRKDSPSTIFPVDKVNRNIWKLLVDTPPSGQLNFDFITGKIGKRQIEPLVMYSLDFNKLKEIAPETTAIVKRLTPYDKRVMVAVAALYNSGNEYFSVSDIYHKMGNAQEKKPSKSDVTKINDSLTKQMFAHVSLNNIREVKAGYKYSNYSYDGMLLQFERVTAELDGRTVERAIHLFREPPLITFAKDRKQITTVVNAVLESPVSKTEQNLQIDDYLIEQISAMKRARKYSQKILFKTLFEECQIGNRNLSRVKETIERYLKHYKKTNFIHNYIMGLDSITIMFE